ncbi:hypothetical protein N9835_01730 [Alphaproteobacteria bacterium]|nr:hypothetical protein [Alphaproteobacteria bacterium]
MNSPFQIKNILFYFISFILFNTPSFSSSKLDVTEVNNDIFILDIYGKRFNLKKNASIKIGDFLKTKNLPASFILKNKSKICLSANSSLKIGALNFVKQNYEITFEFNKGNLFLKIPDNSSNKYNINFFSYSFKNFKNNIFLSRTKEIELVNYGTNLNLFFKEKMIRKVSPLTYFKLSKNGNIINTNRVLNNDNISNKFLKGCIPIISRIENKNNSDKLQYSCVTQNGKLVCGNRYK